MPPPKLQPVSVDDHWHAVAGRRDIAHMFQVGALRSVCGEQPDWKAGKLSTLSRYPQTHQVRVESNCPRCRELWELGWLALAGEEAR